LKIHMEIFDFGISDFRIYQTANQNKITKSEILKSAIKR
jgi:hypothetical protein